MAVRPPKERVVAAAQSVLRIDRPALAVDGIWGPSTQRTFDAAPPSSQMSVKQVADSHGYSLSDLSNGRTNSVDVPRIRALVTKIAREEGVPPELALKVANLESKFDPAAKSPTGYLGLFQLHTDSMTDAHNFRKDGVDWDQATPNRFGPRYKMRSPFDAEQNARVGCRYLRVLAERYLKVPLTDYVTIYMAYNIGVQGARNVKAGRPQLAAREIAANPAYGRGGVEGYQTAIQKAIAAA